MGTMRLAVDARQGGFQPDVRPDRLGELLADRSNQVWLDISDPGPDDVALLRREFGFHESALEEILKTHDRPRCDAFGNYDFLVVYAAEQAGKEFLPQELNLFWGEHFLVTIHHQSSTLLGVMEEARRRWGQHEARQYGVACLSYVLFETLVDNYFTVQDRLRERIEDIEEAIFTGAEGAAADIFRLRKELLLVPRLLAPTSRVLAEVLRRERAIPEGLRPYFADVEDHAQHVLAELDTSRDLLGAALDVQAFYSYNRLGHVMKRLTAVTVIIMVPNLVASIYGMNFTHLMPPSDSEYAFLLVVLILAIMVTWGFIHSRLLGWL